MSMNDIFIIYNIKMKYKSSYWWWQKIISTHKSIGDVRRYLIKSANMWKDLIDILSKLSPKDGKEASELFIHDDEIYNLFIAN